MGVPQRQITRDVQLNLSFVEPGKEKMREFTSWLGKDTEVTDLRLCFSQIKGENTRYLADALRENSTVRTLRLGGCKIHAAGAQLLAHALRKNQSLHALGLGDNKLGPTGAEHIAWGLATNLVLQKLDLGSNMIGEEGADALAMVLKENHTLKALRLHGNIIGDDGAERLAAALKQNQGLLDLCLSCNGISDTGALHISGALRQNTVLVRLDLGRNYIREGGADKLVTAWRQSSSLAMLCLASNPIGRPVESWLADSLDNPQEANELVERSRTSSPQHKDVDKFASMLPKLDVKLDMDYVRQLPLVSNGKQQLGVSNQPSCQSPGISSPCSPTRAVSRDKESFDDAQGAYSSGFGESSFHMNVHDLKNRGKQLIAEGHGFRDCGQRCPSPQNGESPAERTVPIDAGTKRQPQGRPWSASPEKKTVTIISMAADLPEGPASSPAKRPRPLSSPGLRRGGPSEAPLWSPQPGASPPGRPRPRPQSSPGARSASAGGISAAAFKMDVLHMRTPHTVQVIQRRARAEAREPRRDSPAADVKEQKQGRHSSGACKRSSSEPGVMKIVEVTHWFNRPGVADRPGKPSRPSSSQGFRSASYAETRVPVRW